MAEKPTPSISDALAAMIERDVVPGFEVRRDGSRGVGIVAAQEFERAIGEHHAEAEGGVARVLLDTPGPRRPAAGA